VNLHLLVTLVPRPQSGVGESGEDAPSEANFAETMTIAEAQEAIQVTANSAALSRLDKRVAQPAEGSAPEEGKALMPCGSKSSSSCPTA